MTAIVETLARYAVLIQSYESAAVGFSLREATSRFGKPDSGCWITVTFVDGKELGIAREELTRPTISVEAARESLIEYAREILPRTDEELHHPCGIESKRKAWRRWVDEGPTDEEIRRERYSKNTQWLSDDELDAYEKAHL